LPDGEIVVQARLQEENEAKKVLAGLEDLDLGSAEFERQFALLQSVVVRPRPANHVEYFADSSAARFGTQSARGELLRDGTQPASTSSISVNPSQSPFGLAYWSHASRAKVISTTPWGTDGCVA
jgi:hypothetical protein